MLARHFFLFFIFILGLGGPSGLAWAFDVPPLTGPVVDQVGLLSASTRQQLENVLQQTYRSRGPQVQVLIVSSLGDTSIEQAAIQVFERWKLGSEKEDNGVLFLIAPTEKKLRIEVGRGLEGDIPDAIAKRIVSDIVRPYFQQGEFNAGVVHGVQAILYYGKSQVDQSGLQAERQSQESEKADRSGSSWIIFVILGFWVLLFIFNPSLALAILFSGGRGGGGRMGGGGGWSGGGGSSAGGGASGSW